MKYNLRYEIWTESEFCLAAFRYPDHADKYLKEALKSDSTCYLRVEKIR